MAAAAAMVMTTKPSTMPPLVVRVVAFQQRIHVLFVVLFLVLWHSSTWHAAAAASSSSSSLTLLPQSAPLQRHHQSGNSNNNSTTRKKCKKHVVLMVVGSANIDTFLPVARLPTEGENLTTQQPPLVDVPGGKGCTQAVAASKLLWMDDTNNNDDHDDDDDDDHDKEDWRVRFVGQFGSQDDGSKVLMDTLRNHRIDVSHCGFHEDLPSGRGYVFLSENGSVSAVVSGGSNQYGWDRWRQEWERSSGGPNEQHPHHSTTAAAMKSTLEHDLDHIILKDVRCILLQREVPEYVNLLIASRAKRLDPSILIFQDVGGEDRPISPEMLQLCDYLVPNESELKRLALSSCNLDDNDDDATSSSENDDPILKCARALQQVGASNVLVTRGSNGSVLVTRDGSEIIHQPAIRLPSPSHVVDETGAGDCFRAALCVALMEGHGPAQSMLFASAAGSCSVEVNGSVPSTPSRSQVLDRMAEETVLDIPRGDGQGQLPHGRRGVSRRLAMFGATNAKSDAVFGKSSNLPNTPRGGGSEPQSANSNGATYFPFLFGSRLNSMKDRPDLWKKSGLEHPRDYVARQATVEGLTCVDFNYPQHFSGYWTTREAKAALDEAGLVAGAVCLRYPSSFARGAMNHPTQSKREEAMRLTKEAAEVATELGTNEVVVWSAFDGYDYPFQVDYDEKWDQLVSCFQELCDSFPSIKFSLEYKPTDENTRFFTVPTTGAALLLVEEVNRPNMGLTLDVGHMLMAGENPGHSIAMVGRKKKLFGIQLNDGYTRLAAEDGLIFGSVHPSMALEIMFQLRRTNFSGHLYFDTFPQRSDPVLEANLNIRQAKRFWSAACSIDVSELKQITDEHDAIAALEMTNRKLRGK